jgi:hypothetical protein
MRSLSWLTATALLAVTTVEVEGSFYDNPKVEQPPEGGTPIEELKAKWGSDVSSICYSGHTVEISFHAVEIKIPGFPPLPPRSCSLPETQEDAVQAFTTPHVSLYEVLDRAQTNIPSGHSPASQHSPTSLTQSASQHRTNPSTSPFWAHHSTQQSPTAQAPASVPAPSATPPHVKRLIDHSTTVQD